VVGNSSKSRAVSGAVGSDVGTRAARLIGSGPAMQRKPQDPAIKQRNLWRPLDLKLAEVMVEVLIHQRRPFDWGERAEEEVGMTGADGGPAGYEAVD
jgi:hypothetical protein